MGHWDSAEFQAGDGELGGGPGVALCASGLVRPPEMLLLLLCAIRHSSQLEDEVEGRRLAPDGLLMLSL